MMHAAVAQLSSQPLLLRHYCISSSRVLPESAFPITIYMHDIKRLDICTEAPGSPRPEATGFGASDSTTNPKLNV